MKGRGGAQSLRTRSAVSQTNNTRGSRRAHSGPAGSPVTVDPWAPSGRTPPSSVARAVRAESEPGTRARLAAPRLRHVTAPRDANRKAARRPSPRPSLRLPARSELAVSTRRGAAGCSARRGWGSISPPDARGCQAQAGARTRGKPRGAHTHRPALPSGGPGSESGGPSRLFSLLYLWLQSMAAAFSPSDADRAEP